MANSDRNTLGGKSREELTRQQRSEVPRQAGAEGNFDAAESEDQARNETLHRHGKTRRHTSSDRPAAKSGEE